ncbi:MAG: sigma-70 family RNA polymerase sigma factor [Erysipelotrichaceae bacterium]|nr:sigma-70 family RNA polymerase sigma factor [Erysipelotrichaceae bacterium]
MSLFVGYIKNGPIEQPLSKEEEDHWTSQLKGPNHDIAREKLILHNLRLVIHIVKKYEGCGELTDDLISIGTVGLIKSIDSYSNEKGVKIATYAAKCIDNEILMYLRSNKKYFKDISLSDTISVDKEGNSISLIEVVPSFDIPITQKIDKKDKLENLIKYVSVLDDKEKEILNLRYGLQGEKLTQKEVSKKFNISRSYVSRIEKRALTKLLNEFRKN